MAKRDFKEKKVVEETVTDVVEQVNNPVEEVTEEAVTDVVNCAKPVTSFKLKKQFSDFKLNVREEASASSKVIAQINNNDSIELIFGNINDEWYKVKVNNSIEGWVMSQYLEKSE